MSEWIDISVPLRSGMVHWPGDISVNIRQTSDMQAGDRANLRTISMSAHTGTHMDAPLHFVPAGGRWMQCRSARPSAAHVSLRSLTRRSSPARNWNSRAEVG